MSNELPLFYFLHHIHRFFIIHIHIYNISQVKISQGYSYVLTGQIKCQDNGEQFFSSQRRSCSTNQALTLADYATNKRRCQSMREPQQPTKRGNLPWRCNQKKSRDRLHASTKQAFKEVTHLHSTTCDIYQYKSRNITDILHYVISLSIFTASHQLHLQSRIFNIYFISQRV